MNREQHYNYILIDLDGTILDGKEKHYRCYKDIMGQAECCPMDRERYWKLKRKAVPLERLLCGAMEKEIFLSQWRARIETKKYLQYDKLKPQIAWALDRLTNKASHLWLVTNRRNEETLEWQLKKLGIWIYFERVICIGKMKGDDKAAALPDVNYENSVLIGDTEMDEKTAKKIGIEFIPIYNGLREKNIFADKTEGEEEVFQIKWLKEEQEREH